MRAKHAAFGELGRTDKNWEKCIYEPYSSLYSSQNDKLMAALPDFKSAVLQIYKAIKEARKMT
jgi:hypothetical protein